MLITVCPAPLDEFEGVLVDDDVPELTAPLTVAEASAVNCESDGSVTPALEQTD
jgi:hypothetical protein